MEALEKDQNKITGLTALLEENNKQHQNEITKLKAELEKEKIKLEKEKRQLEEKLELQKDYEVIKNNIDNLKTSNLNEDSLFNATFNLAEKRTFNHDQLIILRTVWKCISNKIEEIKKIDKENLMQKITKLEQQITDLTTNVVSSDITDHFIENYLQKLESWKINQQWKTRTDFHGEYVIYKNKFKEEKINEFKRWVQLIISTKKLDVHNKNDDDETANKIIKYALLAIIKVCEPYSNVLDEVKKKSTKDWEIDNSKPVIIQDNIDINTKLNSTPLFNRYQSFNSPQEIIKNLITEGKYQLIKEIDKILPKNMLNNFNSSSQIENKLSLKVRQILNNIKEYIISASKLNKNLSESLSSLSSNNTVGNSITSRVRSWFTKKRFFF